MMHEETLQYIAERLLQHGSAFPIAGLLYGKMGFAVFFFHYARFTGEKSYEDHAFTLIDSIQRQIAQWPAVNYADGLAGIGAAIEYLEQNHFVEINTNEILGEIDSLIFRATVFGSHKDASLFTGLSGLGRYLLFRVTGNYASDSHIGTLNNKMLLIHLTDTFDRMVSLLNKADRKDVFRFFIAMNPGLYGGLAGVGLYLLSNRDKTDETWHTLL